MRGNIKYAIVSLIFLIMFVFKDYVYDLFKILQPPNNNQTINIELEILKSENFNLKNELENLNDYNSLKLITNYDYIISKVSIRNPYTFYDSLVINQGEKTGIKNGMPVISDQGLVGIIGEVNQNSSKVDLITKQTNEISVIIHGSYGILSGYSREKGLLIVKNMNNYNNIEVGDYVYTSGLGKLPQGILIGKVQEIIYDNYHIEQSIYVSSKIDIDSINYVGVVTTNEDK